MKEMAENLALLIGKAEKWEREGLERLEALTAKELAVNEKEARLNEREETLRKQAESLVEFQSVADERRRNQDLMNLVKKGQEALGEAKNAWAREQAQEAEQIRQLNAELTNWKARLEAKEKELTEGLEELRKDKVAHHDRVLKELSEIELRKMRAS